MYRPRILMTRFFCRWANGEGLTSSVLLEAVREIKDGLFDGDLGGGLIKKRIRVPGRGKSGGARVVLVTDRKDRWIFVYGFLKNERANISRQELAALRELSRDLLALTKDQLYAKEQARILFEISTQEPDPGEPHLERCS